MMQALYIGTYVVCLIAYQMNKRCRFVIGNRETNAVQNFGEAAVLLAVFLLITANRVGVDLINYIDRYKYAAVIISTKEVVYGGMAEVCRKIGLNYYQFRALFTLLTSGAAVWALKKLKVNIFFFLIFYLPSMLFIDSMLVRNTAAFSFLIIGIYFLASQQGRKGKLLCLGMLLLAVGCHSAYILYFPMLLYDSMPKNKKILVGLVLTSAFVVSIATFTNGNSIPFIKTIYSLFLSSSDARTQRYLTSGHFGFLYPMIVWLITLYSLWRIKMNFPDKDCISYRFLTVSLFATEITAWSIPFLMMNQNYYRYPRSTFVLQIISTALYIRKSKISKKKFEYTVYLTAVCVLWWIFEMLIYQSMELLIDPVLRDGVFFFVPG